MFCMGKCESPRNTHETSEEELDVITYKLYKKVMEHKTRDADEDLSKRHEVAIRGNGTNDFHNGDKKGYFAFAF